MSRRLTQITDWTERAAEAQWCVNNLALACGVSLPQLERHFDKTWGQCPRVWLQAERMRRACELLERRERIKDVAALLQYGHPRNFTRAFTERFGYSPREHLALRTPNSELRTPNSELRTPNSELRTPNSELWLGRREARRFVTRNESFLPLLIFASLWFNGS